MSYHSLKYNQYLVMSEAKIKEETHKLKNLIRLFHATKSVPTEEVTRNSLQNYITEVSSCRSSRDLWDRFNMEELLLRLHPILEGKEISESISRIQGPKGASSATSSPLIQSSSMLQDKGDFSKQLSEISEDSRGLLDAVSLFIKTNEKKVPETILINKNLPDEISSKDSMYIIGCSEPKDNKALVLCGIMKYSAQEIIDLSKDPKDLVCFMNSQRVPIAVAKILGEGEELDPYFLHSIIQINCKLNLGIIKSGTKVSMFQITPQGVSQLNSCPKDGPHKHKWQQKNSQYIRFFEDKQVVKCFVDPSGIQTKNIRRNCEKNNVIKVQDCIQLSEKIEAKNYNYKFVEKYYTTIKWGGSKFPYFTLIPNESNVLDKLKRYQSLEEVIRSCSEARVVVCSKVKDIIPVDFSKALLKMKEAVACAVLVKASGNMFLLYKLSPQATENKITDVLWEDIENGKNSAVFQKLFMYSRVKAKQYESKLVTAITQV